MTRRRYSNDRQRTAARAQADGAEWEAHITQQCELLAMERRALVTKIGNPWQIVGCLDRDAQRFEVVPGPPQALDYQGVIAGGRAVYLEAKSTGHATRFDFSLIADSQIERAAAAARHGALVLLLVERRHELMRRDHHVFPVDAHGRIAGVAHKRCVGLEPGERTGESINWQLAAAWKMRAGETWLDAAARLCGPSPNLSGRSDVAGLAEREAG